VKILGKIQKTSMLVFVTSHVSTFDIIVIYHTFLRSDTCMIFLFCFIVIFSHISYLYYYIELFIFIYFEIKYVLNQVFEKQ